MFKKQPSDNQLIFVTFILVVLMAFPTFQTLAQNEGPSDGVLPRSPASVPVLATAWDVKKETEQRFAHLDLNCASKPAVSADIVGDVVQLQGKNCITDFKDGDVEIVNKSNGFTASIFDSGMGKYQTDLIQLQQGENEIAIRYRQKTGKVTEHVLRVRSSSI